MNISILLNGKRLEGPIIQGYILSPINQHHTFKWHALSLMHPIIQHPRCLKLFHSQGYRGSCQSLHKECHRRTDLHQELSDELLDMSHKRFLSAFWTWFCIESTKTFITNNGSTTVSYECLVSEFKTDNAVTLWYLLSGISLLHTKYYKQAKPNQEKIIILHLCTLSKLHIMIMTAKNRWVQEEKGDFKQNQAQTPVKFML